MVAPVTPVADHCTLVVANVSLVTVFSGILILFSSCSTKTHNDAEYYVSETSKELLFPFSDASIVGGIIYVSGQVGSKPGTREIVEGGIGAETTQILNNIKNLFHVKV